MLVLQHLKRTQVTNFTSFLQSSNLSKHHSKEIPLHQQVMGNKRLATYYGEIGIGIGRKKQGCNPT